MHQFKLILNQSFIYTSLVGWLGSGTRHGSVYRVSR